MPAVDRERLKTLFVEMWCAEQRGASAQELLAIYHKYDYPPLENWYAVWHAASMDSQWARNILEAARSNCWDVVKAKMAPVVNGPKEEGAVPSSASPGADVTPDKPGETGAAPVSASPGAAAQTPPPSPDKAGAGAQPTPSPSAEKPVQP